MSSSVSSDSRMAASSSIISTEPMRANSGSSAPRRVMTAASDMHSLLHQRKVQVERRAFTGTALHSDFSRVLLNNSITHRQSQARAFALPFARRRFGGEKRVINTLDVFLRDSASCVGDGDADAHAIRSRNPQLAAARHGIARVQKQVQEHLLQASRIALDWRKM